MRKESIFDIKSQINGRAMMACGAEDGAIAFGRSMKGGENVLAVRIYSAPANGLDRWMKNWEARLAWLAKLCCGEMETKFVGEVRALPPTAVSGEEREWYQKRCRPLKIGASISHGKVTAGTTGCFVKDKDGNVFALSNNHVLANQNDARKGDKICQPGTYDGGSIESDMIGTLEKFVEIKKNHNLVDAAIVRINKGEKLDQASLFDGFGKLSGTFDGELEPGDLVCKCGRTTGAQVGRVTAVDLDNVGVGYDAGPCYFDGQIEVEGADDNIFCRGGDSGSMVVTGNKGDKHEACALLFAGSNTGGTNGKGLTYVSPMKPVLDLLKIQIFC